MELNEMILERKITIYDMAGATVREVIFSAGSAVNTLDLPCGTYRMKFTGTDGSMFSNELVILRP